MATRRASHAGSWYVSDPHSLGRELDDWLARASASHGVGAMHARAIIGPHAGYRYCGACGGHAYARIRPEHVKRVFILGPSHHVRLSGCALSACAKYATPFYDLTLDRYAFFIQLRQGFSLKAQTQDFPDFSTENSSIFG